MSFKLLYRRSGGRELGSIKPGVIGIAWLIPT